MNFQTSSVMSGKNDGKVISYLSLRQIIGVIGITLPFLLMIGTYFLDECSPSLQYSISHYYYTKMHMLFVGLLCVLGAFLITYKGNSKGENSISTFAGLCSIFVSIFPDDMTKYIFNQANCSFISTEKLKDYVPKIHFTSATFLFLSFAIICFCFFTRPDDPKNDPIKKRRRNIVYKTCGIGIIISLILCYLFMNKYLYLSENFANHSVLFFETTALFFFGFSWLLKGSLMWPSKKYIFPFLIKFFR
jgi:hypothetical protein